LLNHAARAQPQHTAAATTNKTIKQNNSMVYWGCGTERNRAAWAYVVTMAATGAALFILGAAKFDACRRLPPETTRPGDCGAPPRAMLIAGAAMIVAALPPLLFFSGCAAPPAAADGCEVCVCG
jgi:hypothetical protein